MFYQRKATSSGGIKGRLLHHQTTAGWEGGTPGKERICATLRMEAQIVRCLPMSGSVPPGTGPEPGWHIARFMSRPENHSFQSALPYSYSRRTSSRTSTLLRPENCTFYLFTAGGSSCPGSGFFQTITRINFDLVQVSRSSNELLPGDGCHISQQGVPRLPGLAAWRRCTTRTRRGE